MSSQPPLGQGWALRSIACSSAVSLLGTSLGLEAFDAAQRDPPAATWCFATALFLLDLACGIFLFFPSVCLSNLFLSEWQTEAFCLPSPKLGFASHG